MNIGYIHFTSLLSIWKNEHRFCCILHIPPSSNELWHQFFPEKIEIVQAGAELKGWTVNVKWNWNWKQFCKQHLSSPYFPIEKFPHYLASEERVQLSASYLLTKDISGLNYGYRRLGRGALHLGFHRTLMIKIPNKIDLYSLSRSEMIASP